MSRGAPADDLDISVVWSRTRPLNGEGSFATTFQAEFVPVLEEASRLFKETAVREDYLLLGFVVRLSHPIEARAGEVMVDAIIDDRPRRVAIQLDTPVYEKAVEAHRTKRVIAITGDLVKEGRSYRLKNPAGLQILDEDDTEL